MSAASNARQFTEQEPRIHTNNNMKIVIKQYLLSIIKVPSGTVVVTHLFVKKY